MTPLDKLLARLRELESCATKGPWMESLGVIKDQENVNDICAVADREFWSSDLTGIQDEANSQFIVITRNTLPVLLQVVERQNEILKSYAYRLDIERVGCEFCSSGDEFVLSDCGDLAKQVIDECDALAQQAGNQP